MSEFRGYDPADENITGLLAESLSYSPLLGDAAEPIQVLHPKEWLRIENQGSLPSCAGNALSTVIEWVYYLSTGGKVIQLSRMFGWTMAQKLGGSRPSKAGGASIYGCAKVAKELGVPEEDLAPYGASNWRTEFPPQVYKNAEEYKILNTVVLDTADKCFDFLAAGVGGIEFGVPWEFSRGSWHAVAGVGVPQDDKICIANSWGKDWDGDGWTEWSHDKLSRYLDIDGSVAIGFTDMDRPHVRPGWDASKGGLA
jgi:hypothetical protein